MSKIEYAELARKLWPFMAGYVGQYSGGNSVITAAASSSPSGGSAPDYASFLTLSSEAGLSAERVFTLATNSGLSGTDAGAGSTYTLSLGTPSTLTVSTTNALSGSNHSHAITSSSNPGAAASILASDASGILTLPQFTASTKVRTPLLDTASGDLSLTPSGNVVLTTGKTFAGTGYASQTTSFAITQAGAGDFRYLFTDEMHAKSFIADLEQALAGGQIIAKSVTVLYSAFTMPNAGSSGTFVVRDLPSATGMRVFEERDIVRFRSFNRSAGSLTITDAWGEVTLDTSYGTSGFDSATKTQRYTYLRRQSVTIDDQNNAIITDSTSDAILSSNITTPEGSMAGGTVIAADSIVLDYGKNQSGIHEINAIDGVYGTNSPYAQIVSWQVHPKNPTVRTRTGNLNGIFGVANEYGFYAGSGTASTDQYLRLSSYGVALNNVPLALYSSGSQRVNIDSSGTNVWFSSDGGTTKQFNWTGDALTLNDASLNLTGTGVLSLSGTGVVRASSAGIYGIDSSGKPTFSLVNSNTTVNSEALTAGDTLLGDNSSNKGNVLFDQSAGKLRIRNGTTDAILLETDATLGTVATFEGAIKLGTSGGIYQGSSGSFSSVGTGIKIWRGNGTTDGGAAGDCIIGVFDSGGYTMSITPSAAITIVGGTGYDGKKAVNYVNSSGTRLGEAYGYTDGASYNAIALRSYSTSSSLKAITNLVAANTHASGTTQIILWASKFTDPNTFNKPWAYIDLQSNASTNNGYWNMAGESTSEATGISGTVTGTTSSISMNADNLYFTGAKSGFHIDHPLHPLTQTLSHTPVDGDQFYTFYAGEVTLDASGAATVTMPDWFTALNGQVMYQLTCVDGYAPVYVTEQREGGKVSGAHRFTINGGAAGQRVCWQVTGVRHDPFALYNPFVIERDKDEDQRGTLIKGRARNRPHLTYKPARPPAQEGAQA